MIKALKVLQAVRLTSAKGAREFIQSVSSSGINLMTLMQYASKQYAATTAVVDERGEYTYLQLYERALGIAAFMRSHHKLKPGMKAGLMCRNHAEMIASLFALSSLDVEAILLNTELKEEQVRKILKECGIQLVVYDKELENVLSACGPVQLYQTYTAPDTLPIGAPVEKTFFSKFTLLTGGTTGAPKATSHKSLLYNFISPFYELLTRVRIQEYSSVFIPLPLYHGFGLSALFISFILGKTVYLLEKFDAGKAAAIISRHKIEVITAVPLMIRRLVEQQETLDSLRCIISGGAALDPALHTKAVDRFGPFIFNLYGTSEAGFSLLATPADLLKHPGTIGKPITDVRVKLLSETGKAVPQNTVGMIHVKNQWSAINKHTWIATGDLAFMDREGYYYLRGLADDMIVSGGQNVYPAELENILLQHPGVEEAAVKGIQDDEFWQRLQAFIVTAKGTELTKEDLLAWLKQHAPSYLKPKHIHFLPQLPHTSLGKPDKKALRP